VACDPVKTVVETGQCTLSATFSVMEVIDAKGVRLGHRLAI
jgi:hypothetical protein